MKKEQALLLFFLFTGVCYGQVKPGFNYCPEYRESCGPHEKIDHRTQLSGPSLQKAPYSYILHQEIKRFSTNYSTGPFIAPDMILTAHHNVYSSSFIRSLRFCNKAVDPEKWISFKRSEVEILLFGSVAAPSDIAIIKFNNPEKIKALYRGHFNLDSIEAFHDTTAVHLTGFPCDLPDLLVDKQTRKDALKISPAFSLIGYDMYTCTGDSGAPLWAIRNKQPVLLGIHHGGGETYYPLNWNAAAKMSKDVIHWINNNR